MVPDVSPSRGGRLAILVSLVLLGPVVGYAVGIVAPTGPPAPDVVTVTKTEPADEEAYEYLPSNDSVRVVVTRDVDGPSRTRIVSFESFARSECLHAGLEAILGRLEDEFGPNPAVGSGRSVDRITVWYYPGKILAPDRAAVNASLPETVRVTVHIGSRTHTCALPVRVAEGSQPIPG